MGGLIRLGGVVAPQRGLALRLRERAAQQRAAAAHAGAGRIRAGARIARIGRLPARQAGVAAGDLPKISAARRRSPAGGDGLERVVGGELAPALALSLSLCVPLESQPEPGEAGPRRTPAVAGETPTLLQAALPLPEKELLLEVTSTSLPLPLGIHWPLEPTLPLVL